MYFRKYCMTSSVHSAKYIVDEEMRTFERIIWAILLVLAVIGTTYVCILLSQRFNSSPLATVVESTIYPVYNILYPAITICNFNRINWNRINDAVERFIPNSSNSTIILFKKFVARFENFEFGNFDEFDEFRNVSLKPLDHINLEDLAEFMAHRCGEMFIEPCWWRNREISCCEYFVVQKSEYGICYAFNSAVNAVGWKKLGVEKNWPWRTSTSGDWSGLRLEIKLDPNSKPPQSTYPSGIIVIVHSPEEWPSEGNFIPSGTASSVVLKPKLTYARSSTRRMKPDVRECIFSDETSKPERMTLPGFTYLMRNCASECRQRYLLKYCNCTVDFFFPYGNYTPCKASDFHCLNLYDDIFNLEKSPEEVLLFDDENEGMVCNCILECYSIDYQEEVAPFHLANESSNIGQITLDVHYQHSTLIKYRTDVIFGWLDLMVAFGGIAGLFLGCSLLSGVELLYYLTIGVFVYLNGSTKKIQDRLPTPKFKSSKKRKINAFQANDSKQIRRAF